MSDLPLRKHGEVLRERLVLAGRRVVDIGCGDGGLVRLLARAGARVIGVEISSKQLARARAKPAAANETYLLARGEALPFAPSSIDLVTYFNSLHHLPEAKMLPALKEAAGVLRPEARLCVVEPLAEGEHFALMQPVEDETRVRALAKAALDEIVEGAPLERLEVYRYAVEVVYPNFEVFRDGVLAVDPRRATRLGELQREMMERFNRLGEACAEGRRFLQPMRLDLLVRMA